MGTIRDGIEYIDEIEGRAILEDRVQRDFGVSLDDWLIRYRSGRYDSCDRHVASLSMMLPFAGYSTNGHRQSSSR